MNLPWSKKKDLHIFNNEYEQAVVSNRVFNRLLENDQFFTHSIGQIKQDPLVIDFASDAELIAFELSGTAIWTDNIMELSATKDEMFDGIVDDRFCTATGNNEILNDLSSGMSYIDLTPLGQLSTTTSSEYIADEAKKILGNYVIVDIQNVIVQVNMEGSISLWWWLFSTTLIPKVVRYRYEVVGGQWIYKGRIINSDGRLYI